MSGRRRRRAASTHPAVRLDPRTIVEATPWIRRFALWMGVRRADVDDVVQDVILRAWRASERGRYRPDPSLPADRALIRWLHTITWNQAWPALKRAHRDVPYDASVIAEQGYDLDAQIDASRLLAVVASLPEPRRSAVLLAALGYDFAEIARILGSPRGTALTWASRGRRLLRRLLDRMGR